MRRVLALTSTIARRARRGTAWPRRCSPRRRRPPHAAPSVSAPPTSSWADPQIRAVTAVGILGDEPGRLPADGPADPRRAGRRTRRVGQAGARLPADPAKLVTMSELDAQLVGALGLLPAARRIRIAARDAEPRADVAARHRDGRAPPRPAPQPPAGLRRPRAAARRSLRRGPRRRTRSPAPLDAHARAGRAGSTSSARRSRSPSSATGSGPCSAARFGSSATRTSGPAPPRRPRSCWSATAAGRLGRRVPGGFDCSGFVWRVYKTKPFPGAPLLGDILKGRTTFAMSAEVKKPARIGIADLEPGDVIFFGSHGPQSTPARGRSHRASTSATAGSSTRRAPGVTLQPLAGLVHEDVRLGPAAVARGRARRPDRPSRLGRLRSSRRTCCTPRAGRSRSPSRTSAAAAPTSRASRSRD